MGGRGRLNDPKNLFDHGRRDNRNARFDNTAFLRGNLGERLAEILGVVESNVGNNGSKGRDYVCRIKATAQACFPITTSTFCSWKCWSAAAVTVSKNVGA